MLVLADKPRRGRITRIFDVKRFIIKCNDFVGAGRNRTGCFAASNGISVGCIGLGNARRKGTNAIKVPSTDDGTSCYFDGLKCMDVCSVTGVCRHVLYIEDRNGCICCDGPRDARLGRSFMRRSANTRAVKAGTSSATAMTDADMRLHHTAVASNTGVD